MEVSLTNFKMYISQQEKQDEPRKPKTKEDYIISSTNFVYKNHSTSYANNDTKLSDRHLITLVKKNPNM
mgnify:CR=1 FL=1|jgi:hypothetical protein